jgi:TonB family protein
MRGFRIIVATILSTVIHFFIFTLLDTVPLISKEISPQPNLYMVDLVSLAEERPAPQREEKPAVQPKVEEAKKEESKRETVKKEEVKKTPPKDDKVVLADPDKKQENKEKTEKHAPGPEEQLLASIEKIKKNVAAREQEGDSPGAKVTAAEIQEYQYVVSERVRRSWAILNIWSEEELEAFIVIEIDERGQVTSRFEESSGNLAFDQAALRAIRKAAPFDPPPGSKALTFPPMRFSSR